MKLCEDHDEDCPSIFAEGYCLKCWLHDTRKGFCPYLRPTDEPAPELAHHVAGKSDV